MESYIGTNIRFETASGCIEGRLKEIKRDSGVLVIERGDLEDSVKEVLISEIKKLEIVKNSQAECAGEGDNAESQKENKCSADIQPKPEAKNHGTDLAPSKSIRQQLTRDFVTEEVFSRMLNDAFTNCYPTEDAFLSVVSLSILKIATNVFKCKLDDRIAILIRGDDVFSRLGYVLAATLLNSNLSPDIHSTGHTSPKTVEMHQRFLNSGHKISSSGYKYDLVIVCSGQDDKHFLRQLSYQHLLFCCLPKECKEPGAKYGLAYGVKTDRVSSFNGKVFCIDVGFTDPFLRKYGVRRHYPSSVFCLTK